MLLSTFVRNECSNPEEVEAWVSGEILTESRRRTENTAIWKEKVASGHQKQPTVFTEYVFCFRGLQALHIEVKKTVFGECTVCNTVGSSLSWN